MIGTALFLLCATAIAHAELDDSDVDSDDFYENGCPKDATINKLLPDEDCTQYFECVHGEMLRRLCPHGLHFNADLEKCDWYGNADCHNKRFDTNNTVPEELDKSNPNHASLICSTPDSKGVLVAHKHCHEFYKCLNGRPVVLKCAEGLLYSTVTEQCDSPVDCGERVLTGKKGQTITPTTSKEIEYSMLSIEENDNVNSEINNTIPVCLSKLSEGVEIPHDSCDKYYKCTGGIAITIKCPINHLYNPIKEFCDWSQNVDCDGRTISENDTKPTTESNEKNNDYEENDIADDDEELGVAVMICAAENSAGVLVSHSICNHFYKCIEKKPVAFYCPGDLLFNSVKNYCDWPGNVRCGSRTKPVDSDKEEKIEDPRQAYTICSAKDSDDVLIPHQYCNKFYKCHDEVPVVVKCPGILLYNTKTENCDWPTHVYCKDRIVPENGWSRKEEDENDEDSASENVDENNLGSVSDYYYAHQSSLDSEGSYRVVKDVNSENNVIYSNAVRACAAVNSEGKNFPHENCNQYYKCIESKAIAFFCDLNLFYHPKKEYCEIENFVNCSSRVVPEYNHSDQSSNFADPTCMGKADGALGSSEICNQFFKCVNGRPYTMYCPPGLLFNDIRNSCDWPTNVHCGKRITEARMINKREVKIGDLGVFL